AATHSTKASKSPRYCCVSRLAPLALAVLAAGTSEAAAVTLLLRSREFMEIYDLRFLILGCHRGSDRPRPRPTLQEWRSGRGRCRQENGPCAGPSGTDPQRTRGVL